MAAVFATLQLLHSRSPISLFRRNTKIATSVASTPLSKLGQHDPVVRVRQHCQWTSSGVYNCSQLSALYWSGMTSQRHLHVLGHNSAHNMQRSDGRTPALRRPSGRIQRCPGSHQYHRCILGWMGTTVRHTAHHAPSTIHSRAHPCGLKTVIQQRNHRARGKGPLGGPPKLPREWNG